MERFKQVENDKYGMIKIKHQMIYAFSMNS